LTGGGQTTPPPPPDVPNQSWTKADIIEWLRAAGVTITDKAARTLTKDELLDLAADITSP